MRGFLWCQGELKRGKAKVSWDSVCLPKEEGGLGIRRLATFNTALITFHIWSIVSLQESLWVKWIHTYKLKGRSFWEIPFRGNMSWSWRKLLQNRPVIRHFFWSRIGNGCSTSAWYDNWCDKGPLIDMLSARQISNAGFRMDSKVRDIVSNGEWRWPSSWSGNLVNIPIPDLVDNKADEVAWKDRDGKHHRFSVGVAWHELRQRDVQVCWYNLVWFSHSIPRHAFLLWLIFKRKLKTQDMLRQWDISGMDASMLLCPLCRLQPDSHDHLFFECPFSSQVWLEVTTKVNLHMASSSWVSIVNRILPTANSRSMHGIASKLILAASAYYIWQERNKRLFQQERRTHEQLISIIFTTVRLKLMSFKFKETRRWGEFRHLWNLPSAGLLSRKT